MIGVAFAVMTAIATPATGKKVISKTINDSDPSERATLGGADKLVRVKIDVESDETTPYTMKARLVVNNSYRSEEHTSELQSHSDLVCRLLLEKKKVRH